eukprot:SAG11_NODE_147_length_14771_cov_3.279648_10_plen_72_part_00
MRLLQVSHAQKLLRQANIFTAEWEAAHADQVSTSLNGDRAIGVTLRQFSDALVRGSFNHICACIPRLPAST